MGIAVTGRRKSTVAWTTPIWILLPHFVGIWLCEEGGSSAGGYTGVVYVWTTLGRWYLISPGVDLVDHFVDGCSIAGVLLDGLLSILLCIEDALCLYGSSGLHIHFYPGGAAVAPDLAG